MAGYLFLSKSPSPASQDSIAVSSQSTGNFSANAFSGFTTPGTTVFTSAGTKYIKPNPDNDVLVELSNTLWRDVEVTVWTAIGTFDLRMAGGRALIFYVNTNFNSGQALANVGVVENFVPGSTLAAGVLMQRFFR
jgi:hypothetical protein